MTGKRKLRRKRAILFSKTRGTLNSSWLVRRIHPQDVVWRRERRRRETETGEGRGRGVKTMYIRHPGNLFFPEGLNGIPHTSFGKNRGPKLTGPPRIQHDPFRVFFFLVPPLFHH